MWLIRRFAVALSSPYGLARSRLSAVVFRSLTAGLNGVDLCKSGIEFLVLHKSAIIS